MSIDDDGSRKFIIVCSPKIAPSKARHSVKFKGIKEFAFLLLAFISRIGNTYLLTMSGKKELSTVSVAPDHSEKNESDVLSTYDIIAKALKRNAKWDKDSFPEFMTVLYWMRQFIGISAGVVCGVLRLTGAQGFVLFVLVNTLLPFFYYRKYANINIDDFGPTEVLSEGYQPSFGMFMLVWIVLFSFN